MRGLVALVCGLLVTSTAIAEPPAQYGSNPAAAATFVHEGVTLYFETYGSGEPLLIVHGNGGSIADVAAQIAHFQRSRRVIAMDSRDHGRSSDSADPITYERMADDLAALIDHLGTGPVDVVGWSDGGIEALLLGIRHPAKVRKLVAMAANLNPTTQAVHPETIAAFEPALASIPEGDDATPAQRRERKTFELVFREPNIAPAALAAIAAPTLVIAGDHDLIRDEHTVEIFQHLPNAQLAILPNATHFVPYDDPATFNAVVERFLVTPFVKRDRAKDALDSLARMRASAARP
ncbi:MAG: alpha/beta hydrolase [Deltaproteobacteria bacterium]|nr:alpha/beta hydrolase [Deltaproteobacteria bacterium]